MSVDVKTQTAISEAQKTDYRFWLTFQHAVTGMALVLPDGRFQRANAMLRRMLGCTERELRELDLHNVTHRDDIGKETRLLTRALANEIASYRLEKRFTRADGTTIHATVSASLVHDKVGKPLHFIYMAAEAPAPTDTVPLAAKTDKLLDPEDDEYIGDWEARENLILDALDDAAILHTPTGIITGWNAAATRIYGYSLEKALGKSLSLLIHPDRQHEWARALEAVANGEHITGYETVHVASDGHTILVSVNITPLGGDSVDLLTVARDVTERKLLTDDARENRNVMAQVLEGLPVALYLADADGLPFYANAAAVQLLGPGIVPKDNNAPAYAIRVAATDDPYPQENLPAIRALLGESAVVDDMEVHRPTGATPVQAWGQPIYDLAGQIIYVLAAFREIGDRRTAEGALLTVRDRFRAVCDNIPDLISIFDLKGQYLYASQACARLLGYTPDELVGTDIRIYMHPEDLPVVSKTFGRYFAGSDENMRATYRVRRKDGNYLWMETAARPVLGTYGLKREILGVSRSLEETPDMKASLVEERRRSSDDEREREEAELKDKLTGIKNRRALDDFLSKKLGSRRASTYPLGCLLVDIDSLKEINKKWGQEAGDGVIKKVADIIRTTCRTEDFVGRLAGDEFVVVLPNTDASGTVVVGEKLVSNVRSAQWDDLPGVEGVTISVGGTCIVRYSGLTESGLIEILDAQLYEAKQCGRDRFIMNARRMATTGSDWSHAARR